MPFFQIPQPGTAHKAQPIVRTTAPSPVHAAAPTTVRTATPVASAPTPASPGKINLGLAGTIGIKTKNVQNTAKQTPVNNNDFSFDEFMAVWCSYKKQIPQLTRIHYLFSKAPEIDGRQIRLEVTGKIIEQEMRNIEPQLVQYLRTNLQNDHICLELTVKEADPMLTASSNTEKVKLMEQKNPLVGHLISEWGLNFE